MLGLYVIVYAIPPLRTFFELSVMGWQDYAVVIIAVIIWAVAIQGLWRYDVFARVLIPKD